MPTRPNNHYHDETCRTRWRKRRYREEQRRSQEAIAQRYRDLAWTACSRGILTPEVALLRAIFVPADELEELSKRLHEVAA